MTVPPKRNPDPSGGLIRRTTRYIATNETKRVTAGPKMRTSQRLLPRHLETNMIVMVTPAARIIGGPTARNMAPTSFTIGWVLGLRENHSTEEPFYSFSNEVTTEYGFCLMTQQNLRLRGYYSLLRRLSVRESLHVEPSKISFRPHTDPERNPARHERLFQFFRN